MFRSGASRVALPGGGTASCPLYGARPASIVSLPSPPVIRSPPDPVMIVSPATPAGATPPVEVTFVGRLILLCQAWPGSAAARNEPSITLTPVRLHVAVNEAPPVTEVP